MMAKFSTATRRHKLSTKITNDGHVTVSQIKQNKGKTFQMVIKDKNTFNKNETVSLFADKNMVTCIYKCVKIYF